MSMGALILAHRHLTPANQSIVRIGEKASGSGLRLSPPSADLCGMKRGKKDKNIVTDIEGSWGMTEKKSILAAGKQNGSNGFN